MPTSDLVADLPMVSNSNPIAGQAITLEVIVRNQGLGASSSTTVRYYRSTDSTVTSEDEEVGSVPLQRLAGSASSTVYLNTNAPGTPGTYYYGACVAPVSREFDTANNCSTTVETVVEPSFTLSGTVRDGRRNGLLLAGVPVRLENGQLETTTTDQSGRYRFPNVSGTVTVTASAPYYVEETAEVAIHEDSTFDFALKTRGFIPYSGTVFITPDLLGPADPTSLQSLTYIGRGERSFFDYRVEAGITVNAYLFSARYENAEVEIQVNPEFGSSEAAGAIADIYAVALGRLPAVLLSRFQKMHINAGRGNFGVNSNERSVTLNTGGPPDGIVEEGFIVESFIHEGGHLSLDGAHANSTNWRTAQAADGVFISTYARDLPNQEDVAESISAYFAVRYFPERLSDTDRALILATIPNRLAYFDEQGFDMSPYTMSSDSPIAQVVDLSNVEEFFIVSGVISGPDGQPLEGIGIWAWQGERENSGYGETGADGVFNIVTAGGSFTIDIYAVSGECSFVGRYDGDGGLTTKHSQAFRVVVAGTDVTDIDIRLPAKPNDLPRIEQCAP